MYATFASLLHVQVRQLIGLFCKVTGGNISAFIMDKAGYKYHGREMEMPWHNRVGFGGNIRKYRMRSASVSAVVSAWHPAILVVCCCSLLHWTEAGQNLCS